MPAPDNKPKVFTEDSSSTYFFDIYKLHYYPASMSILSSPLILPLMCVFMSVYIGVLVRSK
jgi:hypothetical protein